MANRTLIGSLVILATCSLAAQKEWSFPHTRSNGRATPEYNHNGLHVVVNYDYAQRNHKTKWLLLDLAIASTQSFILHRKDITLLTPDGRQLPVALQEELLEDSAGISSVLQNAQVWRRDLTSYFVQRSGVPNELIRFQAFPPGEEQSPVRSPSTETTSPAASCSSERLQEVGTRELTGSRSTPTRAWPHCPSSSNDTFCGSHSQPHQVADGDRLVQIHALATGDYALKISRQRLHLEFVRAERVNTNPPAPTGQRRIVAAIESPHSIVWPESQNVSF